MKQEHFSTDNINIDLHIHSFASFYKDGDVVNNSKKENTNILISALEKNNINMFSITDHNRFDFDLYQKLVKGIQESKVIKKILPGVEFDVQLEEGKPKCHIITIFDDSNLKLIEKIPNKISEVKELKKEEYYTISEFESLLKKIGIKTILIVHQKQSLDNKTCKTDSLSAACQDPSFFMKTGYVDSLEFGSNRTEGIVKDSLNNLNIDFPLITGSDCHDWNSYPYRDSSTKIERKFTALKCLPTFKGLLMSISSFKSRANRNQNKNEYYIESINLNGTNYPLINGVNAIIGDNGSGKTLILNLLCNGNHKYYEKIVKENELTFSYNCESFQKEFINYIEQNEINEKVRNGNLFNESSNYYDEITTKATFSESIFNYFNRINKYVTNKIELNESKQKLKSNSIFIEPVKKIFYLPVINSYINLENIDTDKERYILLKQKIDALKNEFSLHNQYYDDLGLSKKLKSILDSLDGVYEIVRKSYLSKENKNKVKSIISKKLKDYELSLSSRRTSEEARKNEILSSYNNFKNQIIDLINLERKDNDFPSFPKPLSGVSKKQNSDYEFTKTTKYNNLDLKDEFYKYCFNNGYNSESAIKELETKDNYKAALKGCTSLQELDKYKTSKIQGFIDEWSKENTFISEISSKDLVGNTPGEISLVYYKFLIQEKEKDFCVLAIDQPEDDINPKRIKDFLLNYLGSIRDKKQILIVTHNPLLVVNLDVDNVIFLNKNNNKISIKYGALEYEDDYSILDLIKNHLDGGYDAIEGRLKKYDRDNN